MAQRSRPERGCRHPQTAKRPRSGLLQRRQAVFVLGLDQPAGGGQAHDGALDLVLGVLWGKSLDQSETPMIAVRYSYAPS